MLGDGSVRLVEFTVDPTAFRRMACIETARSSAPTSKNATSGSRRPVTMDFARRLIETGAASGCGSSSGKVEIPTPPLTEEQEAEIKADVERVQSEEEGTVLRFDNKN